MTVRILSAGIPTGSPVKLHELLGQGFETGYSEGVELEIRGIMLSLEGEDPDWSIFFGGEVAGRIDAIPTIGELLESIGEQAEKTIVGLQGAITP